MIDSTEWEWGPGICRKHRGQSLPCQVCIDLKDPGLFDPDAKPKLIYPVKDAKRSPNMDLIAKSKSVSFVGVRPMFPAIVGHWWQAPPADINAVPDWTRFEQSLMAHDSPTDLIAARALPGESRTDTKNRLFAEMYGQTPWAALQSSFRWQEASWLEREQMTREYMQRDRPDHLRSVTQTCIKPSQPPSKLFHGVAEGIEPVRQPYHLIQSLGAEIAREPVRVNMGRYEFNIYIPEVLCIIEEESLAVCSSVMENFRTWFLSRLSSASSTSQTPAPTMDTPSSPSPGSTPKETPSSKSSVLSPLDDLTSWAKK